MSKIKKFTDFFAAFGAFASAMYLIMKFMPFEPLEKETSLWGKLKEFFSPELENDYTVFLIMLLVFLTSFVCSRLFPKCPSLHFGLSLLPLSWSFFMFDYIHTVFESAALTERMKDRPMIFLICAVLNTAGAFIDCILADRSRGTSHSVISTWICSGFLVHVSLNTFVVTRFFPEDMSEISYHVHFALVSPKHTAKDFMPFLWIALIYAIITLVSILMKRIHFINAIFAIIGVCYVIDSWHSNILPLFGAAVAVLAFACCLCHLILTFVPTKKDESSVL